MAHDTMSQAGTWQLTVVGHCPSLPLQIDPRGSIPTVVVNACNLAIPMNLDRIRRLCAKMGQQEVAQALQRFQEIRSAEEQASA